MTKHEHRPARLPCAQGEAALCDALNRLSEQGWELLTLHIVNVQVGSPIAVPGQPQERVEPHWWMVLRRPIANREFNGHD